MGCGCFRCNCCCTKKENSDRKSLNSSDNDIIMIGEFLNLNFNS